MNTTLSHTPIKRHPRNLGYLPWLKAIACLAIILVSPGCQTSHLSSAPASRTTSSTKTLEPGDTLRFSFPGAPEYSQVQRIRPDGRISLPLVGEVRAAGRKVSDLLAQLGRTYKGQLQNGEVVITLEAGAAVVYVTGAVGKPSRVILDRPMTAFEAIMEAGGFQAGLANMKKITLTRSENGRHRTWKLDLNSTLTESSTDAIYLKPYDVIHVGERFF